ncbi:hypothetical protein ACKLNO_08385 [Neisseriaceae bacterium B1]
MKSNLQSVALIAVLSFSLSACVVPVSGSHTGQERVIVGMDKETAHPILVTLVEHQTENPNTAIHVCTLKPFTEEYRSESNHRGKAKLAVQKQCLAKVSTMFCQEKDIVCTTYE